MFIVKKTLPGPEDFIFSLLRIQVDPQVVSKNKSYFLISEIIAPSFDPQGLKPPLFVPGELLIGTLEA